MNNFVWNELWTFKGIPGDTARSGGALHRLLFFNAICGVGIVFAVLLLHIFHTLLGWNLYFSNLFAIGLATLWNFGMNARFNWRVEKASGAKLRGALIAVILLSVCSAHAYKYQEDGILEIRSFTWQGTVFTNMVLPFNVAVQDGKWQIKTEFGKDWYTLTSCDGQNIRCVLYYPTKDGLPRPAIVTRGACPTNDVSATRMIWLACASGDYLPGRTTSFLPIPWGNVNAPFTLTFSVTDQVIWESEPHLPAAMTFVATKAGVDRAIAGDNDRLIPDRQLFRETYFDGYVGGEYHVLSETNLEHLRLPLAFEFKRYGVGKKGQKLVVERFFGTITNLSTEPAPITLPALDRRVAIVDRRYGVGVRYMTRTNVWVEDDDPDFRRAIVAQKGGKGHVTATTRLELAWSLLGLAVIAPFVILVVRNYITRVTTPKTKCKTPKTKCV